VTRTTRSGRIAASIAVATAILVAAPVISIIALAMQPAPDVWQTLIKYVLPRSLLDTVLSARRRRRPVACDRHRRGVDDLAA
jgi:iron(III) transport system permease protein